MSTPFEVAQVTSQDAGVEALLERHHALMRSMSPEESCHVMSGDALRASGALVFALRKPGDDEVCAIGALKPFGASDIELKSMHTSDTYRGQGMGGHLLANLLDTARDLGARQAWLETGSEPPFAAARALYSRAGFAYCAPFGTYTLDPLSVFMTRAL